MPQKYQWGTHAEAFGNAEGLKNQISPSLRKGAISAVACAVLLVPQQAYTDPQSAIWRPIIAGKVPPPIPLISGAPQLADLTLQASLQKPLIGARSPVITSLFAAPLQLDLTQQAVFKVSTPVRQGGVPPVTIGQPQADPSQITASIIAAQPATVITPNPLAQFFSILPQTEDRPTTQVWRSLLAGQTPPIVPLLQGTPQLYDFTQQPVFVSSAIIPPVVGAVPPLIWASQDDTSQLASSLFQAIQFGTVQPTPVPIAEGFSGGWEYARRARRRTEEELRLDRERFNVLPKVAEIIADVAIRQADDLRLDSQQRLEELELELEAQGIEYESRYLEVLNIQRERLIDAEIKGFYEGKLQAENEQAILALLIALA